VSYRTNSNLAGRSGWDGAIHRSDGFLFGISLAFSPEAK